MPLAALGVCLNWDRSLLTGPSACQTGFKMFFAARYDDVARVNKHTVSAAEALHSDKILSQRFLRRGCFTIGSRHANA